MVDDMKVYKLFVPDGSALRINTLLGIDGSFFWAGKKKNRRYFPSCE